MEEAKVEKILLVLRIESVHHSRWVSVTRRILWVPQTLQNKTLGVQWGILGLFFSLALLLTKGMKMWVVLRCDNPCQFWRTRSLNVQPSPFSQAIPLYHHSSHVACCEWERVGLWGSGCNKNVIKLLKLESYRTMLSASWLILVVTA